jgi:hypothetical protein
MEGMSSGARHVDDRVVRAAEAALAQMEKPKDPVASGAIRESRCTKCGVELPSGLFSWTDADRAVCPPCAGFGGLEYRPAGDTAPARRARECGKRPAAVVRFSRGRGRYERQVSAPVEDTAAKTPGIFPGCPPAEARALAARTAVRGSGRADGSAAGRARIDRTVAGRPVGERLDAILRKWSVPAS